MSLSSANSRIQKEISISKFPEDFKTQLSKATKLLLKKQTNQSADAIYFFGRSSFDAEKEDLFGIASEWIKQDHAKFIILSGADGQRYGDNTPKVAGPGKTFYTNQLITLGVPEETIYYSPISPQKNNTKEESEAFLKLSVQKRWTKTLALAHPHQITRAMLALIKIINKNNLSIKVWPLTPKKTNWNKRVKGSQGLEFKPRDEHILDEIIRIYDYQ